MRKLRSDALWHKLTRKQQKKIEHWFFVENLSYRVIRERMRTELGVTCTLATIGSMYRNCNTLRFREHEATLDKLAEILTDKRSDLRRIPIDSLAAISGCLLHRAVMRDDDPKTMVSLARVMLQAGARDIRAGRKQLAEEKQTFRSLKSLLANNVAQVSQPAP